MKTMTIKCTAAVIIASTLLLACKKEKSSPSGCDISVAGLSGSYKLTALQYKENASSAPIDYLAYLEACEKDDIMELKSNGTYTYHDAGTACAEPATDHGTWTVTGKTLTSDGKLQGAIDSYDCKTLVYYVDNALTHGDRLTYTMVKQ
ncbi:Lipocalin-like domain-containing protein [Chitinophaga eiseniae]|uniref:Lipocalin-like domain-containing protein n=1 Tax=Chitinophaga eiseniae TaxID=634771 RepID=A0A1T4TC08_9BACT|nr:lipocalin family protein [Chitinophaga eiseniae]SKA37698.1 Lipocalin-like domain-containing protein [Chitinophaga eiseniae]